MRAAAIAPRDSAATVAWNADASNGMLSPNADGLYDTLVLPPVSPRLPRSSLVVKNAAGTTVKSAVADQRHRPVRVEPAPRRRMPHPRRDVRLDLRAGDTWGNATATRTGHLHRGLHAPVTKAVRGPTAGRQWLAASPRPR